MLSDEVQQRSSPPLPSAPPGGLDVRFTGQDYVIGHWGAVLLCLYRGPLTIETLDLSDRVHLELRETHRRGTGTIVLTSPSAGIPEGEVRQQASRMIERHGRSGAMLGSAIVLEGEGFWASAARSAIMAMFLVVRQPFPQRCFAEPDGAAEWMVGQMGYAASTAPQLAACVRELREH